MKPIAPKLGNLIVKLKFSRTRWVLIIIFFVGSCFGIPGVSEAVGAYIGTDYHLSEPASLLLFGCCMVCIAGFGRKNLLRKWDSLLILEPISKMRLSAQGCVVTQSLIQHRSIVLRCIFPRIEILTYSVYAPLSIHGTPYPKPWSTFLRKVLIR